MANKLELYSTVLEGAKFEKNAKSKILAFLLKSIGKHIKITIELVKNTRSHRQNRYYWGCVIQEQIDCFKERWGEIYDKDQVHDWNKSNIWNTEYIDESTGEIFKIPGTSKVSTVEFELRLEKLRQFFELKFEWKIPLPNEELTIDFEDETTH